MNVHDMAVAKFAARRVVIEFLIENGIAVDSMEDIEKINHRLAAAFEEIEPIVTAYEEVFRNGGGASVN